MKELQESHLNQDFYDEFSFYSLKKLYFDYHRANSEELKTQHNSTPKIAFALYDYVKIEDNVFDYLT